MVLIEFHAEGANILGMGQGGPFGVALKAEKFPSLATMPAEELAHLGAALTLAIATVNENMAKTELGMAAAAVKRLLGPELILPPEKQLVLPA